MLLPEIRTQIASLYLRDLEKGRSHRAIATTLHPPLKDNLMESMNKRWSAGHDRKPVELEVRGHDDMGGFMVVDTGLGQGYCSPATILAGRFSGRCGTAVR